MSGAVSRLARRAALCFVALACPGAWAQSGPAPAASYPSRPIKLLVPFTPGSATDIVARMLGESLSATWSQPVIIENRPGAGGTIAAAAVAKAPPDGQTLLVISVGHVVNPQLYSSLPYDTLRDFAAVTPLANLPGVLTTSASIGAESVRSLVALAKSRPGALNFTSGGIGSGSHINGELFRMAANIDVVHVPTKGAQEMVVETITGRADFGFLPIAAALAQIRDGKLRALAVSSSERSPVLAEVPTLAEAGLPDATFDFWIGLLAPAGTPRVIVSKLHDEIERTLEKPGMRQRLASLGAQPMPMGSAQFEQYMRTQLEMLGRVMNGAKLREH